MKLKIINGPNLNLLGTRETAIYGTATFESFFEVLQKKYPDIELSFFQSNVEGELIDSLQDAGFLYDGIILNAGAYTHTSIGIGDTVKQLIALWLRCIFQTHFLEKNFGTNPTYLQGPKGLYLALVLRVTH